MASIKQTQIQKMKIIITCNPQIDNPEKAVFEAFKEKCKDGLDEFTIEVEGTAYRYSQLNEGFDKKEAGQPAL